MTEDRCQECRRRESGGFCEVARLYGMGRPVDGAILAACKNGGWRECRRANSDRRHSAGTGQWADALKGR